MTVRLVIGACLVPLSCLAAACDSGEDSEADRSSVDPASVVGCRDRVEAGVIRPSVVRDLVVGPIAFYRFGENYRAARRESGSGIRPVKIVAIARAGEPFTVEVPRRLGRSLRLLYTGDRQRRTNVFRPCSKAGDEDEARRVCGDGPAKACEAGLTQFAGGFRVDFERDRCLGVRVIGNRSGRTTERYFFPRRARGCRTFTP